MKPEQAQHTPLTWDKVPSVTYGGKPYFYNLMINGCKKLTVVYNRATLRWDLTNDMRQVFGEFETAKGGMKYAERLIQGMKP